MVSMVLHPEVAAEAQAGIDSVVGSNRLPSSADRGDLPFVNTLVSGVLRWQAAAPTQRNSNSTPNVVKEDDLHDGFLIPKGTIIIPNIWKMLHDSRTYSNPMTFNPKRFLGPYPELDPRKISFGFGRRQIFLINLSRRVLADASIFVSCPMTLAVFNISKYVDQSGQVIEPVVDQTTGTVSHPTPFQCSIKGVGGSETETVEERERCVVER
ncbi:hypothetical protein D9756_005181 [Leucocoprinus leucothites]|uniref:Cytochrome P450 n=1 Tax=Leucocoprinus leucothites TaxID=201217 RepID=A0A8H5LKF6_9AGAR|nr:hypothetical protein D9756_005181 [Leucoagaricus leucothites]